ncbi:DUF5704 domain-containing protein, partial [Saccharibacillus sp. CPCC 101409]|uniref:DUF5704 domain-containing protein n=1 Tax=Saccharibacillus sp. CPCC 101409 TaxID=3058041 RepID=UPI002673EDD6
QTYHFTWTPKKEAPEPDEENPDDGDEAEAPEMQEETETQQYPVKVERKFSYWVIDSLGVYSIEQAVLNNYAFNGERIELYPAGYTPPNIVVRQDGTYTAAESPGNLIGEPDPKEVPGGETKEPIPPGEEEAAQQFAESQIGKVKVQNDTLTFNGQTIMDGRQTEEKTLEPSQIPSPTPIGRDVLYSPNNRISNTKTNRQSA